MTRARGRQWATFICCSAALLIKALCGIALCACAIGRGRRRVPGGKTGRLVTAANGRWLACVTAVVTVARMRYAGRRGGRAAGENIDAGVAFGADWNLLSSAPSLWRNAAFGTPGR